MVVLCRPAVAIALLGVVVAGGVAVWYCPAVLGHLRSEEKRSCQLLENDSQDTERATDP